MSDPQGTVQQIVATGGSTITNVAQIHVDVAQIHHVERLFLNVRRLLPPDYATAIENFLRLYLGKPDQPVPFGGRDAILRDLDAWLEDPQRPFALLTAPAGQGKSALLAHWVNALNARNFPVAFVPVSVRFGTNLESVTFSALAIQLARLLGEDIPSDPSIPGQVWRGMVSSYLRRSPPQGRLLVILDGVDEAANWDVDGKLFPLDPPPGLKVLISARSTADRPNPGAWARALVWNQRNTYQLVLPPLDRLGLRDVLEKMGVPLDELAHQPFIVEELHRLTEGDPLLVRLYVDDLWTKGEAVRRLRPEDLRSLRPGYQGYFDQWWEDQRRLWGDARPLREKEVREILNLLSAAFGPLRAEDLCRLADPSVGLSSWTLQDHLRTLARFVVPSSHDQEDYVFAHPRLAEYFWNKLHPNEREELERRFRRWGQQVLAELGDGRLRPRDAPPYLLRYYRAHLERAAAPLEEFRPLVHTRAWAEAWEAMEGSFGGYLGDVRACWERAAAEDGRAAARGDAAAHLGDEIRCALIEASIRSLAANLPPELVAALVRHHQWTPRQALAYIRQNPDERTRVETLEKLLPFLERPEHLAEALAAAREIQDADARADALRALAERLPEVWPEALAAAREIQDADARADALRALAERLPAEHLPTALAAAREIQKADDRARVLAALAERLPAEHLPTALAAAREIQDADARADALRALAERLPAEHLPTALAAAREIQEADARARVLAALAERLPAEHLPTALAAAQEIQEAYPRAIVLAALAERLPAEHLPTALAAAREIQEAYPRAIVLAALAERLPAEHLPTALAAAREIQEAYPRAIVLAALAKRLPAEHLPTALAAAREIQEAYPRALVLADLAKRLPEVWPEALAAAREIQKADARARVLAALAKRLPAEHLPTALAAAREIQDADDRADALRALAEGLPAEHLPTALAAAREIQDADDRADALRALAERLPAEHLPTALAAAREIQKADARARVLAALAERLPAEHLPTALAAAREIQEADDRANALRALAERLPEVWPEALAAAREIQKADARADALRALAAAREIQKADARADALRALAAAREIQKADDRANALRALAERLPAEHLPTALAAAREIQKADARARVLAALAERLPAEHLPTALAAAREIQEARPRANALRALAEPLAKLPRLALHPSWHETLSSLARRTRRDLLADLEALIPVIHALSGEAAIAETACAIQDVTRWWP
jgi:hypothetical protein